MSDDEKSNWTVKNFPVALRKRAINASNKNDESAASWLARAVALLANQEDGAEVYLPGQPGQHDLGQPDNHAELSQALAVQGTRAVTALHDANPPEDASSPASAKLEFVGLSHPAPLGKLDFVGLSQAMQAAVAACSASEVVLPKGVTRGFVGLVNAELRRARGLPPLTPRLAPRSHVDALQDEG